MEFGQWEFKAVEPLQCTDWHCRVKFNTCQINSCSVNTYFRVHIWVEGRARGGIRWLYVPLYHLPTQGQDGSEWGVGREWNIRGARVTVSQSASQSISQWYSAELEVQCWLIGEATRGDLRRGGVEGGEWEWCRLSVIRRATFLLPPSSHRSRRGVREGWVTWLSSPAATGCLLFTVHFPSRQCTNCILLL